VDSGPYLTIEVGNLEIIEVGDVERPDTEPC
jgi:hypothetical protein